MMKQFLLIFSCLILGLEIQAQDNMWVFFTDKGAEAASQLAEPTDFLSADAVARKTAQGIEIEAQDLPVNPAYLAQLQAFCPTVVSTSRWLNAAVVPMESEWDQILALPFVKGVKTMGLLVHNTTETTTDAPLTEGEGPVITSLNTPFLYGRAREQNDMLEMSPLHAAGMTGRDVTVAIFDAGFSGADTIDVFDSLRIQGRILAVYDFVDKDANPYHGSAHGTQVLSTIAANLPGKMVGTAPHVKVLLARTENPRGESQQEEYNWVNAMEWADSIGADIIHSSLGYSIFDDPTTSYKYEQMDGNTAVISQAADLAAARGIIVTVSAGNEGSNNWRYIVAPCDADSVLCIGSVDRDEKYSLFSSIGPSADGRVKPDVVAMGSRTTVASPNNRISTGNGTSFSSPTVAGMVACLRQAHPDRSNIDIIQAVRLSGDQYNFPDEKYGFGVPSARVADSLLKNVPDLNKVKWEMAEKPIRGRPVATNNTPTPVLRYKPKFTANPTTLVQQSPKVLKLSNATHQLESVAVMQGKKMITLDEKSVKLAKSGKKAKVLSRYLMPDEYYLKIETSGGTEYIPFRIE